MIIIDNLFDQTLTDRKKYIYICCSCNKEYESTGATIKKNKCTCHYCLYPPMEYAESSCPICGTWFKRNKKSKALYCSNKCMKKGKEATIIEKYGSMEEYKRIHEQHKKESYLKHYGTEHPLQSKEVQEKIKKTNQQKYGVDYILSKEYVKGLKASWTPEIREKRRKTFQEKYNGNSSFSSPSIKEKINHNWMKKYQGNPGKSLDVKEKILFAWHKKRYEMYKGLEITGLDLIERNDCELWAKCKKCGDEFLFKHLFKWSITRTRCLKCYPVDYKCITENIIREELKNVTGLDWIKTRQPLQGLEIDFYNEQHKIGIELNGLFWHSTLSSKISKHPDVSFKNKHRQKYELSKKEGIYLIQLWDFEWFDFIKKSIFFEILKARLGQFDKKIFARKCFIKEIDASEAYIFLEENHIQGNVNTQVRIGLFYNNELVGLQCFKKMDDKGKWNLKRTVFKKSHQVLGGISKMLSYFENKYKPLQLVDYTDVRLFDGHGHSAMGLIFSYYTNPCVYYTNGTSLFHREHFWNQKTRERMNWNENLTIDENMLLNNYGKIWDCGKAVFVKNYQEFQPSI